MKTTNYWSLFCLAFILATPAGTSLPPVMADGGSQAGARAAAATVLKVRYTGQGRRLVVADQVVILVNGKPVDFRGANLVDDGGRLLVPLRPLSEALGATVSFVGGTTTVSIMRADFQATVRIGGTASGRTLMPLRQLCEALGGRVVSSSVSGGVRMIVVEASQVVKEISRPPAPVDIAPSATPQRSSRPPRTDGAVDPSGHSITEENIRHNLNQLNYYRTRAGVSALQMDAGLNAFAHTGSVELMSDHVPHKHFSDVDVWANGFKGGAAENQGDPDGWFPGPTNKIIDDILKSMMDEGPGGGHHDAIVNPGFRRVGIGLVKDSQGRLFLTNDFSE